MQTPRTNKTIKQFTPKRIFLIFVKSGLLQYNTTNKGSRPEILDDPGERGEEKRESKIFNTTNKGLCSMSTVNFRRETFRREMATSKNETIRRRKRKMIVESDDQGKHYQ